MTKLVKVRSISLYIRVSGTSAYTAQAGAQVDCADRVTGDRPLHIAVALGHTEMISALFRNGADVRAGPSSCNH